MLPRRALTPPTAPLPAWRSKVDALAGRVGARPDLVSRAATALSQCLREASSDEGHTYLPWHRLEAEARRLLREAALQHAAPWDHSDALHLVAQHMHASGRLVAEPPAPAPAEGEEAAAQDAAAQQMQQGGGGGAAHLAPARAHPSFDSVDDLRRYLNERLLGGLVWQRFLGQEHGEARSCSCGWAGLAAPACWPPHPCSRALSPCPRRPACGRDPSDHGGQPGGRAGRPGAGCAGFRA